MSYNDFMNTLSNKLSKVLKFVTQFHFSVLVIIYVSFKRFLNYTISFKFCIFWKFLTQKIFRNIFYVFTVFSIRWMVEKEDEILWIRKSVFDRWFSSSSGSYTSFMLMFVVSSLFWVYNNINCFMFFHNVIKDFIRIQFQFEILTDQHKYVFVICVKQLEEEITF